MYFSRGVFDGMACTREERIHLPEHRRETTKRSAETKMAWHARWRFEGLATSSRLSLRPKKMAQPIQTSWPGFWTRQRLKKKVTQVVLPPPRTTAWFHSFSPLSYLKSLCNTAISLRKSYIGFNVFFDCHRLAEVYKSCCKPPKARMSIYFTLGAPKHLISSATFSHFKF